MNQVETFVFFAAMLLVIILEGACVYWLSAAVSTRTPVGIESLNLVGQWAAPTLPQCWLLGALLVLAYRIAVMLLPPAHWGQAEAQSNRHSFLHLWRWTAALGALQIGAMYLDRFTVVVH